MLSIVPFSESVPPLWLQVVVVGIWVAFIFLLAEVIDRFKLANSEIVRKVVHIGIGHVILLAWWLQTPLWLGVGASLLFSAIALLSYRIPILQSVNGVGRKSLGTFFYAISFALLILLFWSNAPHYAAIGILVMTWGDGLAALIGQRWGRHLYKLWGMQKSWEGSLTMGVVSYVVSCFILLGVQGMVWQTWIVPLVIAIVATGLEAFSKYGIDNLTVPLGSAAIAFLLNQIVPIVITTGSLITWMQGIV